MDIPSQKFSQLLETSRSPSALYIGKRGEPLPDHFILVHPFPHFCRLSFFSERQPTDGQWSAHTRHAGERRRLASEMGKIFSLWRELPEEELSAPEELGKMSLFIIK